VTRAAVVGFVLMTVAARTASAADKVPQLPPTVSVLGQTLTLKTFGDNPDEGLVAEYVPAKETLDHWTLMLGVRVFKGKLTPDQAVATKEQEVQARRANGDYMANAMAFAKGDFKVIDFVVSQSPIVEHNVMSFARRPDGRLASCQIARRYYRPSSEVDDGLRAFMGEIKTNREKYVRETLRLSKDVLK
jgi:hypothetical protein